VICEIALILALDVSGSISDANYRLQRDATAAVLRDQTMVRAIDPSYPAAIAVVMWSTGPRLVIPWRVIRTQEDSESLASELEQIERPMTGGTFMYVAVDYSIDLFDSAPCTPERQVIDVSADGYDDDNYIEHARDRAAELGVTINGLPIVTQEAPDLEEYFNRYVVTPDGFVMRAESWAGYTRAIRNKIIREIAGTSTSLANRQD
jgi:Ca-activated chloride channel family protein